MWDKLKRLVYAFGALGFYHRLINRRRLTVVMFHRVLPRLSPRWASVDCDYAIDQETFAACLAFFVRHYSIVSLSDVLASRRGVPLPRNPLLITFDDGWADTLTCAAPALARHRLHAVCFVATDALDDPASNWWQNSFTRAWHARITNLGEISELQGALNPLPDAAGPTPANAYITALTILQGVPSQIRNALVEGWSFVLAQDTERQMLSSPQVGDLCRTSMAIGAHGASHIPLTLSRDPGEELSRSRKRLETLVSACQPEVSTLSFPHGRYNQGVVEAARACGYRLMFTSQPNLMKLRNGRLAGDLCGRIEVSTRAVMRAGRFRPDLLALHLFARPAF